MTIWIAMLLGLVQGLCEFLPVSSSGHLLLLQEIFGVTEGAMFFTVMLHLATLVAVCIVYWEMLKKLILHPFSKTVGMLVLATIPTVAIALLFKLVEPFKSFYESTEQGKFLGAGFLLTSLLLFFLAGGLILARVDQDAGVQDAAGSIVEKNNISPGGGFA